MITAGLYLKYRDRFAFMIGPNPENSHHAIVRFGGHIEGDEGAIECALREANEEADVNAVLADAPKTYYVADKDSAPTEVCRAGHGSPRPILVSGGTEEDPNSIMFLGEAATEPTPCGETRGVVLLAPDQIRRVCERRVPLREVLDSDDMLLEVERLDRDLPVVPYLQCRFLNQLQDEYQLLSTLYTSDFSWKSADRLIDDELELTLLERSPADPRQGFVPSYLFELRRAGSPAKVGAVALRIGESYYVRMYGGHIAYEVEPEYRGNRYAARSCRLLLSLARKHGMRELWITCNPDNIASRRTCEIIGGKLVEIVDLPNDIDMYHEGERRKCRYKVDLRPDFAR